MVYTGDCGPSEELIKLANEADLLLAEASYAKAVYGGDRRRALERDPRRP